MNGRTSSSLCEKANERAREREMGLLDKLWDDTVAGPAPEAGLGKLRRNPTFHSTMRPGIHQQPQESPSSLPAESNADLTAVGITRRITLVRTTSRAESESGSSSPSSPSSPSTPQTPPGGLWRHHPKWKSPQPRQSP